MRDGLFGDFPGEPVLRQQSKNLCHSAGSVLVSAPEGYERKQHAEQKIDTVPLDCSGRPGILRIDDRMLEQ